MKIKPFAYQLEALNDIDRFDGRTLVAFDLGLGKTAIALWWLQRHPEVRPAVVVCPAFLKHQWQQQAHLHAKMMSEILNGTRPDNGEGLHQATPLVIVNPDILGQRRDECSGPGQLEYLKSLKPQAVVVDESSMFGTRSSKRTRWLKELCRGVPHILALSATPMLNEVAELWPILNILRPDKWPSWPEFARRHTNISTQYGKVVFKGAANVPELRERLLRHVMIRRRKADVLSQLPKLRKGVLPLPMSDPARYARARDSFLTWLAEEHPDRVARSFRKQRLVQFGYLLRLAARLKLRAACHWIDGVLKSGEKLALFATHRKVVRRLHRKFPRSVVVDGSTPMEKRRQAVFRFQTDKHCQLFIGNIKAAGTGLDGLQRVCSRGAFIELPFTPGDVSQVMGRLDRLGQKEPVDFTFLVAHESIESVLCQLLQRKAWTLAAVLDGAAGADDLDLFDQLEREMQR